jgi:hypothetical protein
MKELMKNDSILPEERVFSRIVIIRGQRVIFDFDLAEMYCIEVKVLKQAVRRNLSRFPKDFMFELTEKERLKVKNSVAYNEFNSLRSQFVTLENGNRGQHSKYKPFAFTEQGVAMLSSVINNPVAVAINIQIMRVFVKMRQLIANYAELLEKIEKLEAAQLDSNDHISQIYQIIKELIEPAMKNRPPVGFKIPKTE